VTGVQRLRLQDDLGIACVAFTPDGQVLVTTGCIGGIARIWDATTGELRLQLQHEVMVSGVAFSPDGRLLATSGGKTMTLWLIR